MTTIEKYNEIAKIDTQAGFVANVILNQHSNPGRKMTGLLNLVRNGASVRTGQFAIDTLIIDGQIAQWASLESAK